MKINYPEIPVLAIGFTRSTDIIGKAIRFFSGVSPKNTNAPNHAFIVTEDHGQLFATEETLSGLQEKSLEEYSKSGNRIVAMYEWSGFKDINVRGNVQKLLAETRRKNGEESKYDFKGLFSFVPIVKRFIKPDPKRQWCSENCASIMKAFGATFISETEITPDKLLEIMRSNMECYAVTNYYIK